MIYKSNCKYCSHPILRLPFTKLWGHVLCKRGCKCEQAEPS